MIYKTSSETASQPCLAPTVRLRARAGLHRAAPRGITQERSSSGPVSGPGTSYGICMPARKPASSALLPPSPACASEPPPAEEPQLHSEREGQLTMCRRRRGPSLCPSACPDPGRRRPPCAGIEGTRCCSAAATADTDKSAARTGGDGRRQGQAEGDGWSTDQCRICVEVLGHACRLPAVRRGSAGQVSLVRGCKASHPRPPRRPSRHLPQRARGSEGKGCRSARDVSTRSCCSLCLDDQVVPEHTRVARLLLVGAVPARVQQHLVHRVLLQSPHRVSSGRLP